MNTYSVCMLCVCLHVCVCVHMYVHMYTCALCCVCVRIYVVYICVQHVTCVRVYTHITVEVISQSGEHNNGMQCVLMMLSI